MTDLGSENLEVKRRKLLVCQAKLAELCRSRSYRTDEGYVCGMLALEDPEVMQWFRDWYRASTAYFSAATFLKRATTYRFDQKSGERLEP